jgi:hypothetical protein
MSTHNRSSGRRYGADRQRIAQASRKEAVMAKLVIMGTIEVAPGKRDQVVPL